MGAHTVEKNTHNIHHQYTASPVALPLSLLPSSCHLCCGASSRQRAHYGGSPLPSAASAASTLVGVEPIISARRCCASSPSWRKRQSSEASTMLLSSLDDVAPVPIARKERGCSPAHRWRRHRTACGRGVHHALRQHARRRNVSGDAAARGPACHRRVEPPCRVDGALARSDADAGPAAAGRRGACPGRAGTQPDDAAVRLARGRPLALRRVLFRTPGRRAGPHAAAGADRCLPADAPRARRSDAAVQPARQTSHAPRVLSAYATSAAAGRESAPRLDPLRTWDERIHPRSGLC